MPNTVQVSNSILNWVSDAASLNDSTRATLELWRSGKKQPTFNQLVSFSNKTRIPLGYFFLQSPPVERLGLLEFRTVDSIALQHPSRDLTDTARQMENVQEWMREYVVTEQGERVAYVGSLNANDDALQIATAIRNTLSLSVEWFEQQKTVDDSFRYIRQAISNVGIVVMMSGIVGANTHRALSIDEFRAFTLIDDYAPLIFINTKDLRSGMLFSILHEFVHIGLGTNSLFNAGIEDSHYVHPHETICNAAAAEILAPSSLFCEMWDNSDAELSEKVSSVAAYFKCSQSVIALRAFNSSFITHQDLIRLLARAKQNIKPNPTGGGGDYYRNQASRIDSRFLFALNASIQEGKTLHTEAYRLTNSNRSTFDGLISEARGERR